MPAGASGERARLSPGDTTGGFVRLLGQPVWVRAHGRGEGEAVVIVHVGDGGPVEVARHRRASPGSPAIQDAHFPPAPAGALARAPKARTAAEAEFLDLGAGARLWLTEAAAADTSRMRVKMDEAVHHREAGRDHTGGLGARARRGPRPVRRGRPCLNPGSPRPHPAGPAHQAGEQASLTQGTAGWAALGRNQTTGRVDDGLEGELEGGVVS